LPEKYQVPIVLCDLEGKTRPEVARQLGLPEGTLSSRLARGRQLLRQRLAARGVVLTASSLGVVLTSQGASAAVPSPLVVATVKNAMLFAAGPAAAGVLAAKVVALTEGVLRAMLLTKLKIATVVLLAFGLIGGGMGMFTYYTLATQPAEARSQAQPKPVAQPAAKPKTDQEKLQGTWKVVEYSPEALPKITLDQLLFKGTKLIWNYEGRFTETDYTLNPTTTPKSIDFTPIAGGNQGKAYHGIYELEDGKLKICYRGPGSSRPKNFNDKAEGNNGSVYIVLQREPAAQDADKAKEEQAKLQGVWILDSAEEDRNVASNRDRYRRLAFTGDRVQITGKYVIEEGTFQLLPALNPKGIDFALGEMGFYKQEGIYRIEEGRLTIGFQYWPDTNRPLEFGGKFRSVYTFKRDATPPTTGPQTKDQEAAVMARLRSGGNLWQLALAMHNYSFYNGRLLPPAAVSDPHGKPLLSWRVAVLPYVGHEELYKEFKLDEPWDSPHNLQLLAKMPQVYAPPGGNTKAPYTTCYQVFVGEGTIFEKKEGISLGEVSAADGASNTLMIAEARAPVPWTKPVDLGYAADRPLPEFGGLLDDGLFSVVYGDGTVRVIRRGIDEDFARGLRALITYNGGEVGGLPQDFFWNR
jgi:uncharacterized protein (TIGR03067 family)